MVSSPAKLRISEVFSSLQGEGAWTGMPSTFVRISGCNLRCVWCDTPYASWNPEGPVTDLADLVETVRGHANRHVVVTGGEPMLFQAVVPLTEQLKRLGHTITIETAGTVDQPVQCDLMSISPKLANSVPPSESGWLERHESTRWKPAVVRSLMQRCDYQLKFVVSRSAVDESVLEISSMLSEIDCSDPMKVFLMAEGVDAKSLDGDEAELAAVCQRHGWRLCPRMHIRWFGNRRGT